MYRFRARMLSLAMLAGLVSAAPPVVKTVRVLPNNPAIPHDICAGVATRLKGTSGVSAPGIQYVWDFGDGSPAVGGMVTDPYVIEATHTYGGDIGTAYIARLTLTDTFTGESASREYPVLIQPCVLATRVNMAIDEGLWYLHKTMTRSTSGGVPIGYWDSGNAGSWWASPSAANVNAFEVNGFLKTGPADDPYTETVSRGLDQLFLQLVQTSIGPQTNDLGAVNPDANGNGMGIYVLQGLEMYQGGPFVDAIVASQTPNAIALLGGSGIVGRTYKDIVQDMIDYLAYCQHDFGPAGGGWRYSCNEWPDNSACQWVAIGALAAVRQFGVILPSIVRQWNLTWLAYSQDPGGWFGYTDIWPVWGPYATTPSGMVQLAMDGVGRGNPLWDRAETFMRDNFGNAGGWWNAPKDYYYGLFSLTKSLLLHDSNNDGVPEPITLLTSATPGVPPVDWYGAEVAAGSPTDGVARKLVNDQRADGSWFEHNASWDQYYFETAWAIIMLRRTVVEIPPVARAEAFPNPALAGQTVTFDGSTSFHPNPARHIVQWEWDLDNNGTYETSGLTATRSFPVNGTYQVTLRVTDNGDPALTDTETVTVAVRDPPIAPTANAGGPYNFCTNRTPWFLDGLGSLNPDEGVSELPAYPGNTITEYTWELNGDNVFGDRTGATPDVTGYWAAGTYLIQLRVTDNSALSHPSFPPGGPPTNLSDTDTAQVNVRAEGDPACSCVSNLTARAKPGKADLTWTWRAGAHHYNVYRSSTSGGPYTKIAAVATGRGVYADVGPLTNGLTYYWVVREASISNEELCQSNQASATPRAR